MLSPASVSLSDSQGLRQLSPVSFLRLGEWGGHYSLVLELVGQGLRPEALCLHGADRLGRTRSLVTQLLLSGHKSLTPSLPPPASATLLLIDRALACPGEMGAHSLWALSKPCFLSSAENKPERHQGLASEEGADSPGRHPTRALTPARPSSA